MDKNKKIGFAVIGYGGMGSWHASTCADDFKDTAELIGIYDIKPERRAAAEAEGIHAFSSREELLADERIDLVTVATPNDVHKEIAIAAMAAGKNVISEKPVALSQEELEEMIAASKKYGKLFTVHQNRRWDPDFKCVQKILADNELGKVFRIESRVQGSRGIPGDWRNQKAQRPDGAARNAPGHHSPYSVQPAAGRGDPFARGGAGRRGADGRRGENLREQEQLDFIDFIDFTI